MPFRLLDTPPADGAWNMALDVALAESVGAGAAPVLRFYRWSPACLSFGRNQPARGRYDTAAIERAGIDVVRRPTGGRAVLHDRELTYSIAVSAGALGGPRATYAAVNRAFAAGLRRLGVPAMLQPRQRGRAPAPSLDPCFRAPVEGEVVVHGRKLVGSAQRREAGVILQHGSLLIENDQALLATLLVEPSADAAARSDAAGDPAPPLMLRQLLDPLPGWAEIVAALAAGWAEQTGRAAVPARPSAAERERAGTLAAGFRDPAWTWRY